MGKFLRKGERVGKYKVIRLLDSGGEGASYLATHKEVGEVVLKQYNTSASDPSCRDETERIERRKTLIGQRHPCVAEVLEIFVAEDLYYEILEYVKGVSLENQLERGGLLSEHEAKSIARCCLEALHWLHTAVRLVHRDIKPGNVILIEDVSEGPRCKLIDLGIVLFLDRTRVTRSGVACTFAYAPPEALLGTEASIDGRADLHSLGVMLFEAITGKSPFRSTSLDALIAEICSPHRRRLRDLDKDITPQFDSFVARLMEANPDNRFPSARQALDQLDGLPPREHREKEPEGERRLVLQVASGSLKTTEIAIPRGGVAIGRSMIDPEDRKASRFHARVSPQGDKLLMTDLGTTNGLIYKDKRRRKVRLAQGERVTLGTTTLVCREKGR